jgi:hypothetical protein
MFELLKQQDVAAFTALAGKYGVGFVIVSHDESPVWLKASGLRSGDVQWIEPAALSALPGFRLVFRNDRFAILELRRDAREAGD